MKHTDKNRRPVVQKPYFENIPQELREMKQWVLWRYEWKDSGEGSWSKVPRQVNGDHAASDNPATWSTFAEAQMAWKTAQAKYDGIGFVFTKECGVIGVDVDNCVISEDEDGLQLNQHALHALVLCDSYAEVSPSGTGIHIIGYGQLPRGFKDSKTGIEGYASGRYFTFTGQPLNDTIPLREITTGATQLHNEFRERQAAGAKIEVGERQQPTRTGLSVFERLEKAFKAKNGDQVRALFNGQLLHHESQSEADLALCAHLGFYSDGDPRTLDAMFRQSQAYRDKWDERHGEQTYGQMTIDKALSSMTEFYDPQRTAKTTVQVNAPTAELSPEAQPSQRRAHIFTFKEAVPAMLKWRHTPALTGVSSGWPELDEYYRPVKRYMTVVTGFPNAGKALALYTPLPTPTGWTTMGDVKIGDWLLDENGQPCRVIAATEVMQDRPCYKITFTDGTTIVCDENHEWFTRTERARVSHTHARRKNRLTPRELQPRGIDQTHKRTYPSVVTTKEIAQTLYTSYAPGRPNHAIPVAKPVHLPVAELPVDPYLFGAWLGDGTSLSSSITIAESEQVENISAVAPALKKHACDRYGYTAYGLITKLGALDVKGNKHIPDLYKRASFEQRLALLQGLMDTDGHIDKSGYCEFTNMNQALALDVRELVCSLGMIGRIHIGKATLYGKDCGTKYRVTFKPNLPVFRLSRKLARYKTPCERQNWRKIVSCEPVSSVPVRCVQVDSPSHLYLATHSFIPTHNSNMIDALATRLYEYAGWRFGFLSFETQPIAMHAACISSLLLGKPYSPYRQDAFTDADAIALADSVDDAFLFIHPPEEDMTMERLLPYVSEIIRDPGIDGLIFDPFSELTPPSRLVGSMTHFVQGNLQKFRQFTRANDIGSWLIAHPAKEQRNPKAPDARPKPPTLRDILDSAHFHNMADYGMTVHRPNYGAGGDADYTEVIINKVRRGLPGKLGKVPFKYLGNTGGYEPMDPNLVSTRTVVGQEDNWQ